MAVKQKAILQEERIRERWLHLIEGAEGKGDEIFSKIKAKIENIQPPRVKIEEEEVKTIFGKEKRNLLVASNDYLEGYKLYIGAKDYGKQLIVCWYLVLEPIGLLKKLLDWLKSHWVLSLAIFGIGLIAIAITKILVAGIGLWIVFLGYAFFSSIFSKKSVTPEMMDIFDLEELTAYITTVHHAVLEAVESIVKGLGQDPAKIERRSRGFLNIS